MRTFGKHGLPFCEALRSLGIFMKSAHLQAQYRIPVDAITLLQGHGIGCQESGLAVRTGRASWWSSAKPHRTSTCHPLLATRAHDQTLMLSWLRPSLSLLSSSSRLHRTMATTSAPELKAFTLSMIQLGQITADKTANLAHAKEMIARAAKGEGSGAEGKPDLIVLPVRTTASVHCTQTAEIVVGMLQLSLRRPALPAVRGGDRLYR